MTAPCGRPRCASYLEDACAVSKRPLNYLNHERASAPHVLTWRARALNLGLRLTVKRRLSRIRDPNHEAVKASRRNLEAITSRVPPPPSDVTIDPVKVDGIPAEWVTAPNADPNRALLYLHGGAYTLGSPEIYRELTWRVSRAARARVLVIDYRLAPEHRFPAAVNDATNAWRWLLSNGFETPRPLIAGDSAGGGLTLATLLALRDGGEPLPAGAVCFSPWTDLSCSGESVRRNSRRDPMLVSSLVVPTARNYLGEADPTNPFASPLFGDLHGLPPLLIHVGTTEILLDDSVRFAKKAKSANVDVSMKIWESMPHVFHLFARVLPEGRQAIDEMGRFCQKRYSAHLSPTQQRQSAHESDYLGRFRESAATRRHNR